MIRRCPTDPAFIFTSPVTVFVDAVMVAPAVAAVAVWTWRVVVGSPSLASTPPLPAPLMVTVMAWVRAL